MDTIECMFMRVSRGREISEKFFSTNSHKSVSVQMLIDGNGYISRTNAVMFKRFSGDHSIGNDQIISTFRPKVLRPNLHGFDLLESISYIEIPIA